MLLSLERQSHLPIAFDPATGTLHWPEGASVAEVSERAAAELRPYLADPNATPPAGVIYRVYRALSRAEDREAIRGARLRYDITVILPGAFAGTVREFARTAGHYHPLKPGTATAYPEVYEVLSGRAYWIIQRPRAEDPAAIEEIYAVEAGPGEKAVMLPGFGHVSVNAFNEPLILANWISTAFEYDYGPYRRFRGSGYWAIEGELPDTIEFEKNPNYATVPELVKLRPHEAPELGLVRSQPLYALADDLERLRFLNAPEDFADALTVDRCYRKVI